MTGTDEAFEQRMAELAELEAAQIEAARALGDVLLHPRLDDYRPRRRALIDALGWLEIEVTCGDCVEGRCHWDGATARQAIAVVQAGAEYVDAMSGPCGCDRHEVSVEARDRRNRLHAHLASAPIPEGPR